MKKENQYHKFLKSKSQYSGDDGFEPLWLPDWLFDFQKYLVDWAIRKGRAAIFADCGMGKTPMQLVWAENVKRKTKGRVIILTPLAVSQQTICEADKFDIAAVRSQDGKYQGDIIVTNYERLNHFRPEDFIGCVCDESSILKSFTGKTRKKITRFINKMPYRLLCTATAAPNDYIELGTSSEALGELHYSQMLKRFFKYLDDKGQKKEKRQQDEAEIIISHDPNYYRKLAYRVAQNIGQWRLKYHAVNNFWKWVSSWSRACRMPSDLGFDDNLFILPPLYKKEIVIEPEDIKPGMLFNVPAFGLQEEREERRRTLKQRCEYVANLVNHNNSAVIWCHMNAEGNLLEKIIPEARQIAGKTPDNIKCELYEDFASGNLRVLIIKPKIGAWGLNWQHCNHVVTFASHSYEQYYQSIRRCWRFGQKKPVKVDIVVTSGEIRVMKNMQRKEKQASEMFQRIIKHMNAAQSIIEEDDFKKKEKLPQWLLKTSI